MSHSLTSANIHITYMFLFYSSIFIFIKYWFKHFIVLFFFSEFCRALLQYLSIYMLFLVLWFDAEELTFTSLINWVRASAIVWIEGSSGLSKLKLSPSCSLLNSFPKSSSRPSLEDFIIPTVDYWYHKKV